MKVVAKPGLEFALDGCRGLWSAPVSGNTGVSLYDLNPATDNHGVLTGNTAAEAWAGSDIGTVLAFDGTNDSITIATGEILTQYPFTINAWAYQPTTIPNSIGALCCAVGVSNNQYFAVGQRVATPIPGVFARNTTFNSTGTITGNTAPGWCLVSGVFVSATRRECYYNGRLVATSTTSVPQLLANSNVRIGSGFALLYYPEIIAEVGIYTRAWSASEIAAYAQAGPGNAFELFRPTRKRSRYQPTAPTTNNRRRSSRFLCFPG